MMPSPIKPIFSICLPSELYSPPLLPVISLIGICKPYAAGYLRLRQFRSHPSLDRAGLRLVFRADPAGIADAVQMPVEEGIVDLARARLVAAGIVRKLDMRDAAEVLLDRPGEIPLHDLHVVDVVLQIEIVRADRFMIASA